MLKANGRVTEKKKRENAYFKNTVYHCSQCGKGFEISAPEFGKTYVCDYCGGVLTENTKRWLFQDEGE